MAEVQGTIASDAPLDDVLDYPEKPANVPENSPSVIQVKEV